jgi:hypothetical protein
VLVDVSGENTITVDAYMPVRHGVPDAPMRAAARNRKGSKPPHLQYAGDISRQPQNS